MIYQDTWLHGKLLAKGYRECAARYDAVKAICSTLRPNFQVLDIGANMCYFGIRLTEDFPQCSVLAFESDHFELRQEHVKANGNPRVELHKKRLQVSDLAFLGRFDVILALSVLHHVKGGSEAWIHAMREHGHSVIVEMATSDSKRASTKRNYNPPSDAEVIGEFDSHLSAAVKRQMFLLKGYNA